MTEPLTHSSEHLLSRFEKLLESAPAPSSPQAVAALENYGASVSPQRWSYRMAAAVLERFRPADLRPVDPSFSVESPQALLFEDIQPASGGRAEQLYELKPEVRRASLERLSGREAMLAALDANPDRWCGDSQALYETWLRGNPPALKDQSYRELTIGREIGKWLAGLMDGLPAVGDVDVLLARRDILQSFEHLLNAGFVGRKDELRRLREYVGVLPPSRMSDSLARQLRDWFGLAQRAPLVIHAPGGTGKTALVGRFLYEHLQQTLEWQFPFAYLPLDNPGLRVREPFTLVVESLSQLRRQFPDEAEAFRTFDAILNQYRDTQAQGRRSGPAGDERQNTRLARAKDTDTDFFRRFGELLRLLSRRVQHGAEVYAPALLVIDTFEEAQYRDKEKLRRLWDMLSAVQEAHPTLRVVLSGRAPVRASIGGQPVKDLELGDLDAEAAVKLLRLHGVTDAAQARDIFSKFGGNPLTLKLAAQALQGESELGAAHGLTGVKISRYGVFPVSPSVIRGQLYTRILDHIHDPQVRQLAHPGMVLRKVTPALIHQVLAAPCGVQVESLEEATALFKKLAREHAFVTLEPDGSLSYRSEVRQPMLTLLRQSKPRETRAIHEAAVDFYATSTLIVDRAEELYHRLALDQEPTELAWRWQPGASDYLASALEELPPRALAWLASWSDLEIPRALLAHARLEDWERNIARKLLLLLGTQAPSAAFDLLRERPERSPSSPLFALEARVHWMLGDDGAALKVLDRGLDASPADANLGRLAELLWMKAESLRRLGDREAALATLMAADEVAAVMPRGLCRMQVLTAIAELLRDGGEPNPTAFGTCRTRLAEVLTAIDPADLSDEPNLTRAALAVLGPDYPAATRRGLAAVGVGELATERAAALWRRLAERLDGALPTNLDHSVESAMERTPDDQELLGDLVAALAHAQYSVAGANLAGIEEYREPWEIEIAPEVLAV